MKGKAKVYEGLRRQAFDADPGELGFAPTPDHPRVFGVVMEMGYPTAVATLACFVDGSTSMYFSTGGGIIGGGQHAQVAQVATAFVGFADRFVELAEATTDFPAPAVGRVRFHLLTYAGGFTAEAGEQELGEKRHALAPLFFGGHAVIAQLRLLDARQSA